MLDELKPFATYLRAQAEASAPELAQRLHTIGPTYQAVPLEALIVSSKTVIEAIAQALETDQTEDLVNYSRTIVARRALDGVAIRELATMLSHIREHILRILDQFTTANENLDYRSIRQIENVLQLGINTAMVGIGDALTAVQQELADKADQLVAQQQTIRELSSPIVPIYTGVLVLPLVGEIDARRATQVMEGALEEIVNRQADVLIIDITGVPLVDTSVANHMLAMARAVQLLGAHVVLVGIGADIAQTMVQLGVDLSSIATKANLEAGIAYALERHGYAIQPIT
jgi:rsbT co-antagonist protein RsbR